MDSLVTLCTAADIDILVPTSMEQLSEIIDHAEELPLIITGIYTKDLFARESLWEAVRGAGLHCVGRAGEAPAMYLSLLSAPKLRLTISSEKGFAALNGLPGDIVDTCTGMVECEIDFIANKGVLKAAACRYLLVTRNTCVRVAEVTELPEEMLAEVTTIISRLEYHGPGTLSCFLANDQLYWVDLDVCLNEHMEMSAVAGINIPLLALSDLGLIDYEPEGLSKTLVSREMALIYSVEGEEGEL